MTKIAKVSLRASEKPIGPRMHSHAASWTSVAVEGATGHVFLARTRADGAQIGLWRLAEGEVSAVALGHAAAGLEPAVLPSRAMLFARGDGRVGATMWLARTKERLDMVWTGARFEPTDTVAPAPYIPYGYTIFDPARGVSVTTRTDRTTALFDEHRVDGGGASSVSIPGVVAGYLAHGAQCFASRLGCIVLLAPIDAATVGLYTWDGATLAKLGDSLKATDHSLVVVDGAPLGCDVIVLGSKQRWTVTGGTVSAVVDAPPLYNVTSMLFATDPARGKIWGAGPVGDGKLFGVLDAEGLHPRAGRNGDVGRGFQTERAVAFSIGRRVVGYEAGGEEREVAAGTDDFAAPLPDGALFTMDLFGTPIRVRSKAGETQEIEPPSPWMDDVGNLVAGGDGAVHVVGSRTEGKKTIALHRRFDGTAWGPEQPGPAAAKLGAPALASLGDGRLVAVQPSTARGIPRSTSWFDGEAWRDEPFVLVGFRPLPSSEGSVRALARDPKTGHTLLVAVGMSGPVLAVYAGEGHWKVVAAIALETGNAQATTLPEPRAAEIGEETFFGFRAADRVLVAAGATDDTSAAGFHFEGSLVEVLDALPAPGKIPVPKSDVPVPTAYALAFRDESANKFWTAEIDGAGYTVSWGKRSAKGPKAQSKAFTAKTPEKARAELTKKLAEKIDEGYRVVPEGAEVARTGVRRAFAFTGDDARPADASGNLVGGEQAVGGPACEHCGVSMSLVVRLAKDAQRFPLAKHAGLAVWMCPSTDCRPWEAGAGANAAVLLDDAAMRAAAPPTARAIVFEKARIEAEPGGDDDDERATSKVGGFPVWVQDDATPSCDVCGDTMAFALQVDDEVAAQNFGDSGSGYVFVCPRECSAKFSSQSC
ncbi:hypothetical protein A7982_13943 [Minicystis rosea]|nr:hypothetical protein A7982_13943 [Minicystis rosea]